MRMLFIGSSIFAFVIFAAVIVLFVFCIVKAIAQRNDNNHSPKLIVDATVVAKRTRVTQHQTGNVNDFHNMMYYSDTTYYATFQLESGDRIEFNVPGREYGLLVEGDHGRLTFQGKKFVDFKR